MTETIKLAGYDWRKSAGKAVKALLLQAGAVLVLALGGWLADPVAMQAALKDTPYGVLLVPLLASVGTALLNWAKHRDD